MSSFIFSPANSEDLSSGVFYMHLVNAVPSTSYTTANQLSTSDAIGYVPVVLTGMVYNAQKWTFSNFSFPKYTFNTVPVGVVICKRLSSNFAPSDPIIYYTDITNVLAQSIVLTTGKYLIDIKFPSTGVLAFTNYYNYYSGAYVNNETIPKGLIYLLGSRNNTQPFLSPSNNAVLDINSENSVDLFNRNLDFLSVFDSKFAFNFGSRRIRVGVFAFYQRDNASASWDCYGSNTYTSGTLDNAADWTLLGSSSFSQEGWNFINCYNSVYWKNIKLICTAGNGNMQEIEFYESSMYSTHPDLMSTVIDSSFEIDMIDRSGFGHVWSTSGVPIIQNNSLYLSGNSNLELSTSPLFNLSDRNFELSIDFKWVYQINVNNPGIFNWDSSDYPISYSVYNGHYIHAVGTGSSWLAEFHANSSIGSPTQSNFDSLFTNRVGNSFTNIMTNNISKTTNIVAGGTIGDAAGIKLGVNNGQYITGYARNFKLVT